MFFNVPGSEREGAWSSGLALLGSSGGTERVASSQAPDIVLLDKVMAGPKASFLIESTSERWDKALSKSWPRNG